MARENGARRGVVLAFFKTWLGRWRWGFRGPSTPRWPALRAGHGCAQDDI